MATLASASGLPRQAPVAEICYEVWLREHVELRMRRFLSPLARPTGLLGTGFVVISAAIVANALFLQSGRHPAPLFTTRFEFAAPVLLPRVAGVVVAVAV